MRAASARRSTRAPSGTRAPAAPVAALDARDRRRRCAAGVSVADHEPHVERVLARVVVRDLGKAR